MSTAVEPYQAGVFDLTHKLTVEKHGHTALITINHPPANTWDRESLIGLKQRDVACATFAEVGKRYPDASSALKERVKQERALASC